MSQMAKESGFGWSKEQTGKRFEEERRARRAPPKLEVTEQVARKVKKSVAEETPGIMNEAVEA